MTFFEKRVVYEIIWKKCCRPGQATDDNMDHSHFMLDTQDFKYTLRICNIYCFSTATTVEPSRLKVTLPIMILSKPHRNLKYGAWAKCSEFHTKLVG